MDETTKQAGLLMEAVENQRKIAEQLLKLTETALRQLNSHTHGLPQLVADVASQSVSKALQQGLHDVEAKAQAAITGLDRLFADTRKRLVSTTAIWFLLTVSMAVGAAHLLTPSKKEIAQLRATVEELEGRGGLADLTTCTEPHKAGRLCVRVDLKEGVFGKDSDYFIIKGY